MTKSFPSKEKKQLTEEEKEYKSKRKQIQEKLIKFATRAGIHVSDRLPGAVSKGCHHAIGAGAFQKSDRFDRERI